MPAREVSHCLTGGWAISLHHELERLLEEMQLLFILVADEDGLTMVEAGSAPDDDFAAYSCSAMETAQRMALSGNLGSLICSALVLNGGRMLIMHEANIGGQRIYLSILCHKVPSSVQKMIMKIVQCVSAVLLGSGNTEHVIG